MTDDIQRASVSKVDEFPVVGRLPQKPSDVVTNMDCQDQQRAAHQSKINIAAGSVQPPACCQPLHVSLFFDGTNNNEPDDKKPDGALSNIARLYHASLGTQNSKIKRANDNGYFSYYMAGVGTPFPEIGEMEFTDNGLKYATGGEDRINWALTRLIDAIKTSLNGSKPLLDSAAADMVNQMSSTPMVPLGESQRKNVMGNAFKALKPQVAAQTQPTLLAIKLYVYGFSRGAAEARAFVSWLLPLLERECDGEKGFFLAGLPVTLEFLGLFDTVASVGIAHFAPFFDGHMSWADDTMQLPDETEYGDFIKCCRHFVAAHEQRLCFPLDSVRRIDGKVSKYPSYAKEYVYPGMHSDVGVAIV
ncbi:T6SS phospholipase effector Tle1-like catalytic domain-containing protein [Amantichitinum ursilacus]|uniref:T6SS Phospholipase effector Tle1-like catalytic domain-containing protein n=1 Tax=Amantichitinum ursilacus TaxID=857265 RepID=A0A0N0GPS9_9NEIS|nr:DUF2235 domain-containing protein [Amantichitinum ursilacus]KPC53781.1 hypothetical protein WG78_08055 [Amantichitinum ursilacus]